MTKEFEENVEKAFEHEDANEMERAETLIEIMADKLNEIDDCLDEIHPDKEPALSKVHTTLDHMRDLLAMIAGMSAANIEVHAEQYEIHKAAGAYDEEETADIDLN